MKFTALFRVFTTLLLSCGVYYQVSAQEFDWNNYSGLRASGPVPEIFRIATQDKINEDMNKDRESMSTTQEQIFLEHIHYHMDELLSSGLVLYGDPCTAYVRKVADNLLKDKPKLKKELQFYVVKSNLTNALSTDQGVIFVTLGLLAQIENEAQLAYVISHEIAHFTEKHVEKSYNNTTQLGRISSYDARIQAMSNHSKESELEADKLGIKMYNAAGYKKSELLSTFDVLMYSYLPFDEVALPHDYFNSDWLFIPERYFPESVNPILAEEEYDDDKSSHPNIRKRKQAIKDEVSSYDKWGDKEFVLDQSEFEFVRKLARYESVHLDLIDCKYGDVLYSVFLLEQDGAESLFLEKAKAKAWLGLSTFKMGGTFSDVVENPSDVEGESHAISFMLRKLTRLQILTVAMRQIEDIHKRNPSDPEIAAIRKAMVRVLAGYSSFKEEKYRKINYQTALERFEAGKNPPVKEVESEDSLVDTLSQVDESELSKYDKIKLKRGEEEVEPISEDEEFDEESFHFYALGDLLDDNAFRTLLKDCRDEISEEEDEEQRRRRLSSRERRALQKKEYHLGLHEIILMRPLVVQYYYSEIKMRESAELEATLRLSLLTNAERAGLKVDDFSDIRINSLTTEQYNRQAILTDYLRQRAEYEEMDMFPVDYGDLKALNKKYNGTKLLFPLADYRKTLATRTVHLVFLVMDIDSGDLVREKSYYFRQKPGKAVLNSYSYDIMDQIAVSKKERP